MGHHPLSFNHCTDLSETRSYGSGHPHAVLDCANERPGAASSVNADAQTSAAICRLRWVQAFEVIVVSSSCRYRHFRAREANAGVTQVSSRSQVADQLVQR